MSVCRHQRKKTRVWRLLRRNVKALMLGDANLGKFRKRAKKFYRRLKNPARGRATRWCRRNSTDLDAFARSVDAELWDSALRLKRSIGALRKSRLEALDLHGSRPQDIGGGPGNLALLYWLVRVLAPTTVVETGVASGASSRAILEAMLENEKGHLYSSDLAGVIPREYSGLCVDEHMKPRWTLYHDGDRTNIPRIVAEAGEIDFLHYDSAKDAVEMKWVIDQVSPTLASTAVIVLDDVDRHSFMEDFARTASRSWMVFGYVGIIGLEEALRELRSE